MALTPYTQRLAALIRGLASLRGSPSFPLGALINPVMDIGDRYELPIQVETDGVLGVRVIADPEERTGRFSFAEFAVVAAVPVPMFTIPAGCAFRWSVFTRGSGGGGTGWNGQAVINRTAGAGGLQIVGTVDGFAQAGTIMTFTPIFKSNWMISSSAVDLVVQINNFILAGVSISGAVEVVGSVRARGWT